jgi:hypothetical protein
MTASQMMREIFRRPLVLVVLIASGVAFELSIDSKGFVRHLVAGVAAIALLQFAIWLLRRGVRSRR